MTAAKGINPLADDGLREKRRGIGMFVAVGARQRLLSTHLIDEAAALFENAVVIDRGRVVPAPGRWQKAAGPCSSR